MNALPLPAESIEAAKEAMREVTPPPGVSKADWLAEHGSWALLTGAVAAAAPGIAAQALATTAPEKHDRELHHQDSCRKGNQPMAYTPMPSHLDPQLQSIVHEISSPQTDAGNTVFVIREALAQAYAAGHKDAHNQAMGHQWLTAELQKTYAERKAKLSTQPKDGIGA